MKIREEQDSMGSVKVPADAYFGAQTQRASDNFPISGLRLPLAFMRALALIKKCAAGVNRDLGLLDQKLAGAIEAAAQEVLVGAFDDQFIVDVFQTGSGTSSNMNMNEVIAARANEIVSGKKGGQSPVHPNDHVNMGQSSNDVIPTALHIAAMQEINQRLIPSLKDLHVVLKEKATQFGDIKKIGRTHLQDAVPMFLGQEFSGYARQVELGMERIADAQVRLLELALGGTAVGSGLNAHPDFASGVIRGLEAHTHINFREASNHFEAQSACDAVVEMSGILKVVGLSLMKIANDIRWLGSGPRCGIGEINIPALQPGSSIMPGKVNPVIPEAVLQVGMQVVGNDTTIMLGGLGGNFELNVAMPVMAYNLLQSIEILGNAAGVLATKCVAGITPNREKCEAYVQKSLAVVTSLVPHIGYEKAAALAQKAYDTGQNIKDIAMEEKILPESELNKLLP